MAFAPLGGVRVVDVTTSYAGPTARSSSPRSGRTWSRSSRPRRRDARSGARRSRAAGNAVRRGELREALGRDRPAPRHGGVLRLVDRADVFVQSLRPGLAEGLGLGADALRTRGSPSCPLHDLVVRAHRAEADAARLRPAAPGGRRADQRHRRAGGQGVRVGVSLIDHATGMYAAFGSRGAAEGGGRRWRSRCRRPPSRWSRTTWMGTRDGCRPAPQGTASTRSASRSSPRRTGG